jgi:hypothetical protein
LEADLQNASVVSARPRVFVNFYNKLLKVFGSTIKSKSIKKAKVTYNLFDEFVIECYSPQKEPFTLLIEYFILRNGTRRMKFRHMITVEFGINFYKIPYALFGIEFF